MLNLYELAKVIREKIVVGIGSDGFMVDFLNCEVKDSKTDSIIGSCWGEGPTIDFAADDYFRKIKGRWLVFDAHEKGKRREYSAEISPKTEKEEKEQNRKEIDKIRKDIKDGWELWHKWCNFLEGNRK